MYNKVSFLLIKICCKIIDNIKSYSQFKYVYFAGCPILYTLVWFVSQHAFFIMQVFFIENCSFLLKPRINSKLQNFDFNFVPKVQYYRSMLGDDYLSSNVIQLLQTEKQLDLDNAWEMDNLADESELIDTIINERYLVGDVIAVGRTATVRNGK